MKRVARGGREFHAITSDAYEINSRNGGGLGKGEEERERKTCRSVARNLSTLSASLLVPCLPVDYPLLLSRMSEINCTCRKVIYVFQVFFWNEDRAADEKNRLMSKAS